MTDEQPEDQPAQTYWAVVLHPDGTFATEEHATLEELAARLKTLIDQDVSVSCFHGTRLPISKPPLRYLMAPTGNIALFNVPNAPEPDDSGYLGVDPIHMQDPPQLKMPNTKTTTPGNDEFFDDANDDVMGVFDGVLPDPDS